MTYKLENITKDEQGNLVNVKPQVVIPEEREVIDTMSLLKEKDVLLAEILEDEREVEYYQSQIAKKRAKIANIDAVINKGVELQAEKVLDAVSLVTVEKTNVQEVSVGETNN